MYVKDYDLLTGETFNPPITFWEESDGYAIIAFLLLFVDRKINAEDLKKFDAFMGITGTEFKHDDENESRVTDELRTLRDAIIHDGEVFLDGIKADENRYDSIMDEVDRAIDGNEKYSFGAGYAQREWQKLPGEACKLFDYLQLVIFDTQYNGDRKRLLQHLGRKWNIDKTVLSILEKSAKSLDEISRKRLEIQNSDMIYRDALSALNRLDTDEKTVWDELEKFNIAKDRPVSPFVTALSSAIMFANSVSRIINKGKNDSEEDDYVYEESFADKVGDHIIEGIYKIGDLICSPFEWMSGVR